MLLSSSCGSHWSRELNKKRNSRKGREHTPEWERPRANSPCDLSLKTKNTSIFLLCFFLWPAKQAHPSWQRSDDKDQSERFSPLSTRAFRPNLSYTSLYNFYFPTPNIPLCFPIHKYLHHTLTQPNNNWVILILVSYVCPQSQQFRRIGNWIEIWFRIQRQLIDCAMRAWYINLKSLQRS